MKKILILILISITLISCEKTLTGYELPYERKLVIQGILEAGEESHETNLSITITQPPLGKVIAEEIDTSKIIVYIESEGVRWDFKYKLESIGYDWDASTFVNDDFITKAGKTYNLYVNYDGMTATASTTIPNKPEIIELFIKEIENKDQWDTWTSQAIFAKIKAVDNVVYSQNDEWWSEPMTIKNADSEGIIEFFVDWAYDYFPEDPKYFSSFYSYDYDFYEYVISKKQADGDGFNLFSTSGNNIKWNIKGDGIGIFFGRYEQFVIVEEE